MFELQARLVGGWAGATGRGTDPCAAAGHRRQVRDTPPAPDR